MPEIFESEELAGLSIDETTGSLSSC